MVNIAALGSAAQPIIKLTKKVRTQMVSMMQS